MELLIRNLGKIILAITILASLILIIKNYAKIKNFILEVKTELMKVSWSTRKELIDSTFVVIVITSIIAFFIGVIDIFLSKILSLIFK